MNARGERKYSIKFFDRNITLVGVGTHSDIPHYYKSEKRKHVVIVADDFDMDKVHNYNLSWPDEYPEIYQNNDFVLYDNNACGKNYLEEESSVYGRFGMPKDVCDQINEIAFQDYKNHVISEREKNENSRELSKRL